jgi:hypothetical protein
LAQPTSKQLTVIIEDENMTNNGGMVVHKRLQHSEEVVNSVTISTIFNADLSAINKEFEYVCFDEAVRLLNAHTIRQ